MLRTGLRGCRLPTRSPHRRGFVDLAKAKQAWNGRLVLAEEVEHALQKQEAVVALESTIITHGMPYPANLSTANSVESILREKGVTPATVALINGKVHVGLSPEQLEQLSEVSSEKRVKVSRRDLAPALAGKLVGGTTVAGTMYVGATLGIGMFVTGGIGGVHRGAESSMDISADLIELGRTPMAVVCAGAKSILDIPRTLEVLETQGVCVATYGPTPDFPAFYTPRSGYQSPWVIGTPLSAAELIHAGLSLPDPLSTLLAVPIPEEFGPAGDEVQKAVEQAVKESIEQGIDKRGKEVTPWLLSRVGELTDGSALHLNIKLIENNARVGAAVALELASLQKQAAHASSSAYVPSSLTTTGVDGPSQPQPRVPPGASKTSVAPDPASPPQMIVFGSAALDLTSCSSQPLSPRSTTPGTIYLTPGGVGRNIAEAAQRNLPPGSVMLVSCLGVDQEENVDAVGKMLLLEMDEAGMRTDGLVKVVGERSSACSLVLEGDNDLVNGVADMSIIETMSAAVVDKALEQHGADLKMIVFDCNLRTEVIERVLKGAAERGISTFCDPTSVPKLPRLASALVSTLPSETTCPRPLTHLSPNVLELDLLYSSFTSDLLPSQISQRSWEYVNALNLSADFRSKVDSFTSDPDRAWLRTQGVVQKTISCLPFAQSFWIKAGRQGVVHIHISPNAPELDVQNQDKAARIDVQTALGWLSITHYPAFVIPESEVVSTTGAGDTLVGGLAAGLVIDEGTSEYSMVKRAMEGAGRSIRSRRAVA